MLKINLLRGTASKRGESPSQRRGGDKKGEHLLKSYNGLFDRMMDLGEIAESIEEAAKYKKSRSVVINILERKESKALELQKKIASGSWMPPVHIKHILREGSHKKEREIIKPRWDDEQIVHHMLMRQFRPIVIPRLYRYAYGSLPGRGSHDAVKTLTRWRNEYSNKRFYVFEGDIRKFYDNVDTAILKRKLRSRIRDRRYLDLMDRVIDGNAPGLPKGYYTSPWLANFYLEEFDNFILQELKPDHYLRYMDNLFIYHRNKKELHKMARRIGEFLTNRLHLKLHPNWQVYRFEKKRKPEGMTPEEERRWRRQAKGRAVNALGFVVHRDRVTIRKSVIKRTRAKANHICKRKRCTRHDAASMVSRVGVFKHANAYGYYRTYIKPKVSIQYCKRRISRLAKKWSSKNDRV